MFILKHVRQQPGAALIGAAAGYLIGLGAVAAALTIGGCATTHVGYGPFAYTSDKDVALTKVKYDRTNADGSSEHFSADAVGGTASTVEGARWQALEAAISKIPSVPIVPVP